MSGKRSATSDLNHENWDADEEKEDAGTFKLANRDVIESRVIKKAIRRKGLGMEQSTTKMQENAFGKLGGLAAPTGAGTTLTKTGPFNFLSQVPTSVNAPNLANSLINDKNASSAFSFLDQFKTDAALITNSIDSSESINSSNSSSFSEPLNKMSDTRLQPSANNIGTGLDGNSTQAANKIWSDSPVTEHLTVTNAKSSDVPSKSGRSDAFLTGMREINEDFVTHVANHLEKQPTVILTRCFKDYINHVQKLFDEEKKLSLTDAQRLLLEKQECVLNELIVREPSPHHRESNFEADESFTSDSADKQDS